MHRDAKLNKPGKAVKCVPMEKGGCECEAKMFLDIDWIYPVCGKKGAGGSSILSDGSRQDLSVVKMDTEPPFCM